MKNISSGRLHYFSCAPINHLGNTLIDVPKQFAGIPKVINFTRRRGPIIPGLEISDAGGQFVAQFLLCLSAA
jgi:hypothetical protein